MNEEEVRIAKETLEALFSDSTGEDYPYTEKFGQAVNIGIQALEELEQYRALGTVEELKEAREKQVAKKPKSEQYFYGVLDRCPVCDVLLGHSKNYCHNCGQALKWGEEDEQG